MWSKESQTESLQYKFKKYNVFLLSGHAVVHCITNGKVAGFVPDGVIHIFRWHNPSGVHSACNRKEYQDYFLGVNAAGA